MSDDYDVIVVGAGPAGVCAALAAAQNGARTLLIESSPGIGGNAVSGLPILSCCNSRGEWIVGGIAASLFDACGQLDGYVGCICDWRTLYGVCVSPDVLRLVMIQQLASRNVALLLYAVVQSVELNGGRVSALTVLAKGGSRRITAGVIVDTSGDADVAAMAGAACERGDGGGQYQPVSLVFRLANIDFPRIMTFVRDHPEEFLLAENPVFGKTPAEAAEALYQSGYPYFALSAKGRVLGEAIRDGRMFPCTAAFTWPTSMRLQEVGLNTTRVANVDGTDAHQLSLVLSTLTQQVLVAIDFLRQSLAGFQEAQLAGVASHVGVRETRRIVGEYQLQTQEVLEGRKSDEGIAKGAHHVDIHGAGTYQKRIPVQDGRSYDIPYGCLIPRGIDNVLVAGRSIASTREANGSARVMGTCMATGQAAGVAAALAAADGASNVRGVCISLLRRTLMDQGAILDGTH